MNIEHCQLYMVEGNQKIVCNEHKCYIKYEQTHQKIAFTENCLN